MPDGNRAQLARAGHLSDLDSGIPGTTRESIATAMPEEECAALRAALAVKGAEIDRLRRALVAASRREAVAEERAAFTELALVRFRAEQKAAPHGLPDRATFSVHSDNPPPPPMLRLPDPGEEPRASYLLARRLKQKHRFLYPWLQVRAFMKARLELVRHSALFDARWYASTYPDAAELSRDLVYHFVEHGSLELRSPGPRFHCQRYLEFNVDVAVARLEPLFHFVLIGKYEGRFAPPHA